MAAKSSDKKNRYFFSKNNIRIDIFFSDYSRTNVLYLLFEKTKHFLD